MTSDELKKLMNTGAGIRLSARDYSLNSLLSLATYATKKSAQLTIIYASSLSAESLANIASRGSQNISFEF